MKKDKEEESKKKQETTKKLSARQEYRMKQHKQKLKRKKKKSIKGIIKEEKEEEYNMNSSPNIVVDERDIESNNNGNSKTTINKIFNTTNNETDEDEDDDDDDEEAQSKTSHSTNSHTNLSSRTVSFIVVWMLMFVGAIAATMFMYIGMVGINTEQQQLLDRTTYDILHSLDMILEDYIVAISYIQESMISFDNNNMSRRRHEFQQMYKNMIQSGLNVPMISYNPICMNENNNNNNSNMNSNSMRQNMEHDSMLYYNTTYPGMINYIGFQGWEKKAKAKSSSGTGTGGSDESSYYYEVRPRSWDDAPPYYFPSHMVEPVIGNEQFIDLDLYSIPALQNDIETMLETWHPIITQRIGGNGNGNGDPEKEHYYSFLLMHPGTSHHNDDDDFDLEDDNGFNDNFEDDHHHSSSSSQHHHGGEGGGHHNIRIRRLQHHNDNDSMMMNNNDDDDDDTMHQGSMNNDDTIMHQGSMNNNDTIMHQGMHNNDDTMHHGMHNDDDTITQGMKNNNDTIHDMHNNDTIMHQGMNNNDTMQGMPDDDTMHGNMNNDTMHQGMHNDDDTMHQGMHNNDTMHQGMNNNDTMHGSMHDDDSSSMHGSDGGSHHQQQQHDDDDSSIMNDHHAEQQQHVGVSFTTVRIMGDDLLKHFMPIEEVNVYIYGFEDEFLNGAKVSPMDEHQHHLHHGSISNHDEISKADLLEKFSDRNHFKTRINTYVPLKADKDRTWTVIVIAAPGTYEGDSTVIVTAGVMLFALCAILGAFIYGNIKRVEKVNQLQAQAEREKSALIVENASNAAKRERDLNDFIAHEVRNPLAAAMSAFSFVTSEVLNEKQPMVRPARYDSVKEDFDIIDSSLHFINDLLRNMLDMQRAGTNELKIEKAPTHLMNDVLRPVECMLHSRGADFEVQLECDPNMVVLTDPLRLKQITLNLARNSIKFVEHGFIRLKATTVVDEKTNKATTVRLFVEDSGPGIPKEKCKELFGKFQDSLDSLHQGTGIGLSLCKELTSIMGGKLWIDEGYDSGISGCPGARFVIDLGDPPMKWEDSLLDKYNSAIDNDQANSLSSTVDETVGDVSLEIPIAIAPDKPKDKLDGTMKTCSTLSTQASSSTANCDDAPALELPERLSVLFVDDDMVLRKLFARSVRKVAPNWNVKEASNGETSLSITKTEDFDIIFMDQYMASVQKQLLGTETTRALRAQGVTSKICGLSANDVEKAFVEAGADSFMLKPFPCKPGALRKELYRIINTNRNCFNEEAKRSHRTAGISSVDIWVENLP